MIYPTLPPPGLRAPAAPPPAAAAPAAAHPLRWLIPPVFLLGAWLTLGYVKPYQTEYLGLSAICALACSVLLTRLRAVSVGTLPAWILLGALVLGYFIKFYVLLHLAAEPSTVSYFAITPDRLVYASSPPVAMRAFRLGVAGFLVFCTVATLLPWPSGPNAGPHRTVRREDFVFKYRTGVIVAVVILVATSALALMLGVLVLGQRDEALPFQLVGILFYSRAVLLLLVALALLQLGLTTGTRPWTRTAVVILLAFAVTDMLVRSTRGSLVIVALALALMIIVVRGRIEKSARRAFGSLFAVALLLYPIVTQYRRLRKETDAGAEIFMEALRRATVDADLADIMWSGAASFLTRFVGMDSLVFLTDPQWVLGPGGVAALHARGSNIALYFTNTVVGIPVTFEHQEAPSLVGWFYITGGWAGLVLGLAAYVTLGWWVWVRVWRAPLLVKPTAQVQFLLFWLTMASEGTLDSVVMYIPVITAVLFGMETYLRFGYRAPSPAERPPPLPPPAPPRFSSVPVGR